METSCPPERGRLVLNSCRARYAPGPKEILSRRKPGYQTGRRCLTCWRKSPWAAVNDKGRNVAGGHSSGPTCRAAGETPRGVWVQSSPGARATSGFTGMVAPHLLLTLLGLWFLWEKGLRNAHGPGIKHIHGRRAPYCNTVCAVSSRGQWGAPRRKPRPRPEGARNDIRRKWHSILKVLMNNEMFLKSAKSEERPIQCRESNACKVERDFLIQKWRKE